MEKDSEVKGSGNNYDLMARMQDPRITHFLYGFAGKKENVDITV